ncbi:DNA polymerase IV [Bacillus sp. NRRL B-14911]|uniref:Uncharacterized protein n=1 Tax=Bacillus infantis NRRL B-14911 TaxID=1367477 RepID=U5LFN3_9BACI|nr:hypothetical protein N288_17640 [Bacillus infantis NRRL B-14911]EAR65260.1 DNA polymerase IV [Bacillus sp. NRRL B-14911]
MPLHFPDLMIAIFYQNSASKAKKAKEPAAAGPSKMRKRPGHP